MRLFGTVAVRALVALLVGVAVSAQVAHVDAVSLRGLDAGRALARDVTPAFLTLLTADAVVTVVAAVLAIALAFRRGAAFGARGLAVALAAWSYLLAYAGVVRLFRPAADGVWTVLFDTHFPVVETLGLAGIVSFTASFPRRLAASDLADRKTLPVGLHWLQSLRIAMLRPAGPWVAAAVVVAFVLALTRLLGRPLQDAGLSPAMDVVRFSAVAAVVLNLRRAWVLAEQAGRRRMLWITVGLGLLFGAIVVLIGGNVLIAVTRWPGPAFAWRPVLLDLGLVGLLWGLAMSVFYGGTLDSATIVRGVAALAASASLALFVATGLEVLFSGTLVTGVSLPAGLGSLLALGVAISLHGRIRVPVTNLVDELLGEAPPDPAAG
jgi:hypothetical protein